jgi:hypothetical protein
MGRRRWHENPTPQKSNNLIEYLVGNEDNECPVSEPNRTMINIANELKYVHKKILKEEIMDEITKIVMEKLQERVKQSVQNEFKQYQDITNKKNLRRLRSN